MIDSLGNGFQRGSEDGENNEDKSWKKATSCIMFFGASFTLELLDRLFPQIVYVRMTEIAVSLGELGLRSLYSLLNGRLSSKSYRILHPNFVRGRRSVGRSAKILWGEYGKVAVGFVLRVVSSNRLKAVRGAVRVKHDGMTLIGLRIQGPPLPQSSRNCMLPPLLLQRSLSVSPLFLDVSSPTHPADIPAITATEWARNVPYDRSSPQVDSNGVIQAGSPPEYCSPLGAHPRNEVPASCDLEHTLRC